MHERWREGAAHVVSPRTSPRRRVADRRLQRAGDTTRSARARWPITGGRVFGVASNSRAVCHRSESRVCLAAPRRPVPVSRAIIAEMIREDLAWVDSIGGE